MIAHPKPGLTATESQNRTKLEPQQKNLSPLSQGQEFHVLLFSIPVLQQTPWWRTQQEMCKTPRGRDNFAGSRRMMKPLALWMWWGGVGSPGTWRAERLTASNHSCFQSNAGERSSSATAWPLYFAWVQLPMAQHAVSKRQLDISLTISPYIGTHVER